jgi:hypothetical protein
MPFDWSGLMETKHAPGPWKAIKSPHGPIDIMDCNDHDIVTLYGGNGVEAKEANARLISCAPDLLEALKWYVENDEVSIGMEGNEFWEEGLERGKAAIKKATGE